MKNTLDVINGRLDNEEKISELEDIAIETTPKLNTEKRNTKNKNEKNFCDL